MPIGSIGGMSPQSTPLNPKPASQGGEKLAEDSERELTTVTTKCNKEHKHDQSCPHTTFTQPAPQAGELGNRLDQRA